MIGQVTTGSAVILAVPLEDAEGWARVIAAGCSRLSTDGYSAPSSTWEARDLLVAASRSAGSAAGSVEVPRRRVGDVGQVPITAAAPTSGRELAAAAVAELADVRPTYVRRLARLGVIAGRKTTSGWLLDEDEARAWAAGRRRADESDRAAG